jgi:uncharacterized protein (TIGR03546 family)
MLLLKILVSFFKALNEKASPRALAGGLALGVVIGLTPKGSLHNAVIVLLIFLLPVNKSASLVGVAVFSLFAYVLDPLFNRLGEFLLALSPLQGFWTALYNMPILPWTRFNNTLVLGSVAAALILFIPIFRLATWAVTRYRERVVAVASKWKIVHLLKASKFYMLYEKLS